MKFPRRIKIDPLCMMHSKCPLTINNEMPALGLGHLHCQIELCDALKSQGSDSDTKSLMSDGGYMSIGYKDSHLEGHKGLNKIKDNEDCFIKLFGGETLLDLDKGLC